MQAVLGILGLTPTTEVNIHHNYAAIEHHFGKDVWVHRKGATRARSGEQGIIPGSMGTASYIVEGLRIVPKASSHVPMEQGDGWGESKRNGH